MIIVNPPHGLDHLPELMKRARTSGLDATLTIDGMTGAVQQVFEVSGLLDSLAAPRDDD